MNSITWYLFWNGYLLHTVYALSDVILCVPVFSRNQTFVLKRYFLKLTLKKHVK